MNPLRSFMQVASVEERAELAALAGTTIGTLNQIAGGYRNSGKPNARAGLARRIEHAVTALVARNKRLPTVLRTDLSEECRGCEFAQKCLGKRAAISGFGAVD